MKPILLVSKVGRYSDRKKFADAIFQIETRIRIRIEGPERLPIRNCEDYY